MVIEKAAAQNLPMPQSAVFADTEGSFAYILYFPQPQHKGTLL